MVFYILMGIGICLARNFLHNSVVTNNEHTPI
jgi:hypothetical protein